MGDFSNIENRRAAVSYRCDEGGCTIHAGDGYVRMFVRVEDTSYAFKFCGHCWDLRTAAWDAFDLYDENCPNPGGLRTWLLDERGVGDVEAWFAGRQAQRASAVGCIPAREPAEITGSIRSHSVKCWPEQFRALKLGLKSFEVRRFDRDYQVGDRLVLSEFDPVAGEPTCDWMHRIITYVLPGGAFGVEPGFCVLGLGPC